jgi:hypothetical protein
MSQVLFGMPSLLSEDPDVVVERFKNLPPGVTPLMAASGLIVAPTFIANSPETVNTGPPPVIKPRR